MVSLLEFQYSLNLLHLYRIWYLVLIGYDPHGHKMSSLEKNLRQYLLIGAWLIIALVALMHNELEWLKCCSQGLSLMIDGSIGLRLLFSNFRKNFPLRSATWKDIFHCKRTELHSCFLQKSQDDLHGKIGIELNLLESLSMSYPKLRNMFNFNTTSNPHGYLVLFVSKTPSVVWYFIMDLIPPKVHGYFALFESKSAVIFICIHCLIISFKLCKFTRNLHGVFPSSNLNFYIVFH